MHRITHSRSIVLKNVDSWYAALKESGCIMKIKLTRTVIAFITKKYNHEEKPRALGVSYLKE